ncbi:MAG: photosynthetic reaction center cytochrome c subunit [Acidobacteriia bacterium]|nr:photosynthetic reaction center cytochrome c subunit [Terriglobia bacterium]
MRKLILNVAAFLVFLALVILAQAPDGAAPAFKGPDAVAANLVNTACASCHTLDRVKNKMADKDGWTTTVTRMKAAGANLTDEQVPVVVEFLTRAAGTLTVAAAAPGPPGKGGGGKGGGKGGGGGGGKNVQVLQGADLPATMQSFVQALGLLDKGTCGYCHVDDRSSDAKVQKTTARRMIIMMRAINGTFGDGKQHVTCFTCHRGSPTPLTEPPF